MKSEHIICILDNGILEAYRYALSSTAKFVVSNYKRDMGKDSAGSIEDSGLGNLISFDDLDTVEMHKSFGQMSLVEQLEGRESGYSEFAISMVDTPPPKQKMKPRRTLRPSSSSPKKSIQGNDCYRDVLIAVEKEFLHFDQIQRVPITRRHIHSDTTAINALQVHCSQSSGLVFCYGRVNGVVAVRQLAAKNANVVLGGDFRGHLYPVCGLATDEVTGGSTEVVCSCDTGGKVLVWTVSHISSNSRASGGTSRTIKCIISRRPQRQFLCPEASNLCCDISWNLGVVVTGHDATVSVFSIERNERFLAFTIQLSDLNSFSGPSTSLHSYNDIIEEVVIHRIKLSDDGFVLLSLTASSPIQLYSRNVRSESRHILATYTIRGQFVKSSCNRELHLEELEVGVGSPSTVDITSPVTFLSIPARGNVAISGHHDGRVVMFDVRNLQMLHQFRPHDHTLTCIFDKVAASNSGGVDRSGVVTPAPEQSPIVTIRVGPRPDRPAVLCVTTLSGGLYVCALPDFIRWDRARSQSTLSQLVHVPMAVVKGGIQQAQNLSQLASDGAGQLAQNAKSYADDALAKINKSKLVKNVFSMFGSGQK